MPSSLRFLVFVVLAASAQTAANSQSPPPEAAPARKAGITRMRVTSTVAHGLLLKKIEPVYPQQAEDSHIQGMVILHVIIDTTGNVIFVKYVAGPRELYESAADSVRQWKYRPYLKDGQPIEMDSTVEIKYQLRR